MEYCAFCGAVVQAVSYAPCPKCGNPSNGAPRSTAADGGGRTVAIVIGIVVGGLVLVAVMGIVAAIAIPNLLTAMQRSKQKRTMSDIRSLATAVEAYATDNNEYPKSTDSLSPKYIQTVPAADGWGNRLEYACVNEESGRCTGYAIGSTAKDGRYEGGALAEAVSQAKGATSNFDCDIIYTNGSFVEYPEGAQR
jgi:Tfp pilus assembly protein PilE